MTEKKTLTTADGSLAWSAVREGDFVEVNGKRFGPLESPPAGLGAMAGNGYTYLTVPEWQTVGAHLVREVEARQHGLIPDEPGAVIHIDGDVLALGIGWWYLVGQSEGYTQEEAQALADEHGFDVLVPAERVEKAREEGRIAGIREVASRIEDITYCAFRASEVARVFPEAFEESDR